MICAPIKLIPNNGATGIPSAAFSALPNMFNADIGNGCTTVANEDVLFPLPGPRISKCGNSLPSLPEGSCFDVNCYRNSSTFGDVSSISPYASTSAALDIGDGPSNLVTASLSSRFNKLSVIYLSIVSHITSRFSSTDTSTTTAVARLTSNSAGLYPRQLAHARRVHFSMQRAV
jgi:hypothetical protein